MNVLILGGGGREHALAWGVSQSPQAERICCAPGNAGTESIAENVRLDSKNAAEIASFCRREEIDLVVVGPEAPLVAGVADRLRDEKIAVFGASAEGARLEGSKAHAKELMIAEDVPTARSATVHSVDEAFSALDRLGDRVAVKADGLAAGKGVVMASGRDEAVDAVRQCVEGNRFGEAGRRVVLEEWLEGEEVSLIALVDGEEVRPLVPSQDHKRARDGDRGPNTGGMGAYAPYPGLQGAALGRAVETCLVPIVHGLARRGVDFRGVLYAGLMLTKDGPRVLEYNVRFGDPETQVVLPLWDGDLLEAFAATARGRLRDVPELRIRPQSALTVVAASAGYPESSASGRVISGLEEAQARDNVLVFHAGTARDEGGRIVTAGGRVLAVTGLAPTLAEAKQTAFSALDLIRFEGRHHRTDIGNRGLELTSAAKGEIG